MKRNLATAIMNYCGNKDWASPKWQLNRKLQLFQCSQKIYEKDFETLDLREDFSLNCKPHFDFLKIFFSNETDLFIHSKLQSHKDSSSTNLWWLSSEVQNSSRSANLL